MNKLRSDSTWSALTPDQRQQLEEWLFEENAGYKDILARVQRDFGITTSLMSLSRYYRRCEAQRAAADLQDAMEAVADLDSTGADIEKLRRCAMALINKRLLRLSLKDDSDIKELAAVGRLVLENERRDIQRGKLELMREKFLFDAAEAAIEQQPLLEQFDQEDRARQKAKMRAMRDRFDMRMTGRVLPDKGIPYNPPPNPAANPNPTANTSTNAS